MFVTEQSSWDQKGGYTAVSALSTSSNANEGLGFYQSLEKWRLHKDSLKVHTK